MSKKAQPHFRNSSSGPEGKLFDALSGDLLEALDAVQFPAYIVDSGRRLRWQNAAAIRSFGDLRGKNGTALIRFQLPEGVGSDALRVPGVEFEVDDGLASFRTESPTRALTPLLGWANARGEELEALTVTRPSLEDVYLELTDGGQA